MKIRFLSDVHNEMGLFDLKEIPNEKNMVCVLAGDIGLSEKEYTFRDFVLEMAERHRRVIYIPGNHEFYKGCSPYSTKKLVDLFELVPNIDVGDNLYVTIDDVLFIGATLWADCEGGNALSMMDCESLMNDFRLVRTGTNYDLRYERKFRALDMIAEHRKQKEFVFNSIKTGKESGYTKICVITHHAPSYESINEMYKTDKCNGAYASNLDYAILEAEPDIWIHGHMHDSKDYLIGKTNVVCNPVGYPSARNRMFRHDWILDI